VFARPDHYVHTAGIRVAHRDRRSSQQRRGSRVRENPANFSVWDGQVRGVTVSLIPNRKIVQAWRSADWPPDHFSIVTFSLVPALNGTMLVLDHFAVPTTAYNGIASGWKDYYWKSMKSHLQSTPAKRTK